MPPFHPEPELDGLDFDLAAKNLEKPSFFDQVEAEREREMYMLAVVDEATGAPVRPATEEDLHDFPLELVAPLGPQAPPQPTAPKPPLCVKNMSLSELLAAATEEQGHPVCNHCGAQESPQWRKGPDDKPVLCNACGTRFRRTGGLGPPIPSDQKKRPLGGICAQQAAAAAEKLGKAAKEPRVALA